MSNTTTKAKGRFRSKERGTSIVEYIILVCFCGVMLTIALPNMTGNSGVANDGSNTPSGTPTGVAGVYGDLGFELDGIYPDGAGNSDPVDPPPPGSGCTIGGTTPSGLCGVKA